ncbi:uncharacterized protein [Amphiura filiformis]|uniref:uncharacterized protein n=1 Tax=Amphiura filiformis TaxID=82378 RepID=UPI003B216DE6
MASTRDELHEEDLTYHKRIGRGASGSVYRATWKSKDVAVKIIDIPHDKADLAEIRSLERLSNHENVIKYYGHIITDEAVIIVTELAEKGSLFDHLKKLRTTGSRIPPPTLRRWIIETARGLQHLRKAGLVHRDIKPSNLVLTADDTLKICDFGIAKDQIRTNATNAKGTWQYQAPEIIENKSSPKSDVFAYAVTIWEMITGEIPYKAKTSFMFYTTCMKE